MTKLLTTDDIAAKWQCSRYHARCVIVRQKGFPKPAPGSTARQPRWLESAVDKYLTGEE